jgi:hypothetical protein
MRSTIYLEDYEGLRIRDERRALLFAALRERHEQHGRRSRWDSLLTLLGFRA